MRKKYYLNLLAAIMGTLCVSQVAYAQTGLPKSSILEAGKVYYLYNTAKKGFLVGGNQYGTQASIAQDRAWKVIAQKCVNEDGLWDGETYFITDSVEAGDYRNAYRNVFVEKNGNVFVDQNTLNANIYTFHSTRDRDNLWTIQPKTGVALTYTIKPSKYNKNYNASNLSFSAKNEPSAILPVVGVFENVTDNSGDWCFVLPEDAEKFLSHRLNERQSKTQEVIREILSNITSTQIPVDDTIYLYNPAKEKFLVGENQYQLEPSLASNKACMVVIHKYFDQNKQWDGKTYVITDSVESGNNAFCYRNLFIAENGRLWLDQTEQSQQRDFLWEIVPSKDMKGAYNICPAEQNRLFKHSNLPNRFLGCELTSSDYPLVSLVRKRNFEEKSSINWMFIPKVLGDKVFKAQRKQVLQELILEVSNAYPQYAIGPAQKVYDNAESASDQIETAIGDLRLMLLSGGQPDAKETSFTPLLQNPQFSWPKAQGWNVITNIEKGTDGSANWCGGDNMNPCAEAWQIGFDVCQELKGLPKGLFRIDMQAFSRPSDDQSAWEHRDSAFVSTVIYANGVEIPVHNLMRNAFANKENYSFLQNTTYAGNDASWETPEGSYVLHNQQAASLAFAEGLFDQSLYCYIDNGVVEVGIRNFFAGYEEWSAWDNLRITYLPETKENYEKAIRCQLEKAKETEALAKMTEGVDAKPLYQLISNTESTLKKANISQLRDMLSLINKEVADTRDSVFSHMLFAGPTVFNSERFTAYELENTKIRHASIKESKQIRDDVFTYQIMSIMVNRDDWKLSVSHLQTAYDLVAAYPEDFHALMVDVTSDITSIQLANKQTDDAIATWTRLIECFEKSYGKKIVNADLAQAYSKVAELLYFEKKDYRKSEDFYKKAIYLNTETESESIAANRINMLAYSLAFQKKYDEALWTIDRAIEAMPEEPNYYDSKGEILLMKGDKKGAQEMWNKVISLDPDFATKHDTVLYQKLFKKK